MSRRNKCVVWAGLLGVMLVAAPSLSQACGWCRRAAAVTYSPAPAVQAVGYAASPTCGTCAPVTTYMPITAYRAVYRPVTVTAFSPVQSCCLFGGGTTTYRPITSVMYSTQLVPYTTYRVVAAPAVAYSAAPVASCATCAAAPVATCDACTPGATTTYRIGDSYSILSSTVAASYAGTVTAPAASCCTPTVTQMPVAAPAAAPAPALAPAPQIISPGTAGAPQSTYGQTGTVEQPISPMPTPAPAPAAPAPAAPAPAPPAQQPAVPAASTSTNPMRVPQLIQPVSQSLVHQAVYYQPASSPAPSSTTSDATTFGQSLDVSGWRAAR